MFPPGVGHNKIYFLGFLQNSGAPARTIYSESNPTNDIPTVKIKGQTLINPL